jgi:hypothetical protein
MKGEDDWRWCLRCRELIQTDPRVHEMRDNAAKVERKHGIPAERIMAAAFRRIHSMHGYVYN